MRRITAIAIILTGFLATTLSSPVANAQLTKETREQKLERMKWWTDARFGMFIHWGLYSLPARKKKMKNREKD